jgi:hypothetical protein
VSRERIKNRTIVINPVSLFTTITRNVNESSHFKFLNSLFNLGNYVFIRCVYLLYLALPAYSIEGLLKNVCQSRVVSGTK